MSSAPLLTYCTNVHPTQSLSEVCAMLAAFPPAIRQRLHRKAGGDPWGQGAFPLGLYLSAEAAFDPACEERLFATLRQHHLSIAGLNGFPYGSLQHQTSPFAAYSPDWSSPERRDYANRLADILTAAHRQGLLASTEVSITTVPGGWGGTARGRVDAQPFPAVAADHLRQHLDHLDSLHAAGGPRLRLAIEPEPGCWWQTARAAQEPLAAASATLGLCLDTCHAAVMGEEAQALALWAGSSGRVARLQVSNALRFAPETIADGSPAFVLMAALAQSPYLHLLHDGQDLYDLRRLVHNVRHGGPLPAPHHPWTVHFHVPLHRQTFCLPDLSSAVLDTTGAYWRDLVSAACRTGYRGLLEVETYTWSGYVHTANDLIDGIAEELLCLWGIVQDARGNIVPEARGNIVPEARGNSAKTPS